MFDNISGIMLELNIEWRVNIKFLAKLNKTVVESFQMLNEVNDKDSISWTYVLNVINGYVVEKNSRFITSIIKENAHCFWISGK